MWKSRAGQSTNKADAKIDSLENRITKLVATSTVATACRNVIDGFATHVTFTRGEIGRACDVMLSSVVTQKQILFSIEERENWNSAVYLFMCDHGELQCVAYDRLDKDVNHTPWS